MELFLLFIICFCVVGVFLYKDVHQCSSFFEALGKFGRELLDTLISNITPPKEEVVNPYCVLKTTSHNGLFGIDMHWLYHQLSFLSEYYDVYIIKDIQNDCNNHVWNIVVELTSINPEQIIFLKRLPEMFEKKIEHLLAKQVSYVDDLVYCSPLYNAMVIDINILVAYSETGREYIKHCKTQHNNNYATIKKINAEIEQLEREAQKEVLRDLMNSQKR